MSLLDTALEYIKLGICPTPVASRGKQPVHDGWQNTIITEDTAKHFFGKDDLNIGLLLGDKSGYLVDIDLDCPEAVKLGERYLPPGSRVFGRTSKPASHWLYRVTSSVPTKQFRDPINKEVLLELRSNGGQTVAPGSTHESGEVIEWCNDHPILTIETEELRKCVYELANAVVNDRGGKPQDWDRAQASPLEPVSIENLPPLEERTKRARKYVSHIEPAVSGEAGHVKTFAVAQVLRRGFWLPEEISMDILLEYNDRCKPPWAKKELKHKLESAANRGEKPWGFLLTGRSGAKECNDPPSDSKQTKDWRDDTINDDNGRATKDPSNALLFIAYHDDMSGCLVYDEFADRIAWAKQPNQRDRVHAPVAGEMREEHAMFVQHWLKKITGTSFQKQSVHDAMIAAAHMNTINPLKTYLRDIGNEWDGIPRIDRWLQTYLGVHDGPYESLVGRWWMISCVARGLNPGAKVDHMLILEGDQGKRKSTAVRFLAKGFFLEGLPDVLDKEAADCLNGTWICEIDELSALKRAGNSKIKAFLTRVVDVYRPAYGKYKIRHPRSVVFIGTTNEERYLEDPTGGRRFWPVVVGDIDLDAIERDCDQLWAEAVHLYNLGAKWWPDDSHLHLLKTTQEQRYQIDPWEDVIKVWLDACAFPETQGHQIVTTQQVLTDGLKFPLHQLSKKEEMRVADMLKRIGWSRGYLTVKEVNGKLVTGTGGSRARVYVRPGANIPELEKEWKSNYEKSSN